MADGRLRHRSHVFEGLESGPHALNAMFTGENIGKVVIRVGVAGVMYKRCCSVIPSGCG